MKSVANQIVSASRAVMALPVAERSATWLPRNTPAETRWAESQS